VDKIKILFVVLIVLLYIPLVFIGVNTFYPEDFENYSDYYRFDTCYIYEDIDKPSVLNETCYSEQLAVQEAYEKDKKDYDGVKYSLLVALNLLVLIIAMYVSLEGSVIVGLFLGAVLTTIISSFMYIESESKFGFLLLFIMFLATIIFISKRNSLFKFK
jgi:hypothetical protein